MVFKKTSLCTLVLHFSGCLWIGFLVLLFRKDSRCYRIGAQVGLSHSSRKSEHQINVDCSENAAPVNWIK